MRERLPVLQFRVLENIVSHLPRGLDDVLAGGIASALTVVWPTKFAALGANLAHVVGDDPKALRGAVRANARNWLRGWMDVLEMRIRRTELPKRLVSKYGIQTYLDALARGRGVVVVSLHYGTWEAGLASWNVIGGKMALLAERTEPEALFEYILRSRNALGVTVIPLDIPGMRGADSSSAARARGAAGMREVMRHLRSGGVIAIAIDRDLVGNGAMLDFFGRPAAIPVGAVEVAIRSGAAIIPMVLERVDRHNISGVIYPEISYDPSAPREAEALKACASMLQICEEVIRLHPDQWHVMDPIWRSA